MSDLTKCNRQDCIINNVLTEDKLKSKSITEFLDYLDLDHKWLDFCGEEKWNKTVPCRNFFSARRIMNKRRQGEKLFEMVYQWGRVGVVVDYKSLAFQKELKKLIDDK